MSSLVCLGRHHISGWIQAGGEGALDWSAAYRLFSRDRFDPEQLFAAVRRGVLALLPAAAPLTVALDDTLVYRGGAKTAGVGWRRDPLGPPFHTNFVRGQRFVELSATLPQHTPEGAARGIPLGLIHAPTATKPRKNAPASAHKAYREQQRAANITRRGAEQLAALRQALDDDGEAGRPLCAVVDGRFTNRTLLKALPPRTTVIGRVRADAKLYFPPDPARAAATGRRRVYGESAPTPAEVLADETLPTHEVEAFAAGKRHRFPVKTLPGVLWRTGAGALPLRLVVIKPLRYRPTKSSRLLYRQPAFLLVTDPAMPLAEAVQRYVWRWEIEVNFRDQKTLLGMGDPQVSHARSVERAPQFQTGVYAMLLLAAQRTFGDGPIDGGVPPPKWRQNQPKPRYSTPDLIRQLRYELWGEALRAKSFYRVRPHQAPARTRQKHHPPLAAAVLSASP